jgi:sulfite exporter TauE/SafE
VGLGTSIFLIAVGAILKYAVTADVQGVEISTVGVILMVVGAIGLVLSLLWMTIWADRRRTAVADRGVVREREVVDRDVY